MLPWWHPRALHPALPLRTRHAGLDAWVFGQTSTKLEGWCNALCKFFCQARRWVGLCKKLGTKIGQSVPCPQAHALRPGCPLSRTGPQPTSAQPLQARKCPSNQRKPRLSTDAARLYYDYEFEIAHKKDKWQQRSDEEKAPKVRRHACPRPVIARAARARQSSPALRSMRRRCCQSHMDCRAPAGLAITGDRGMGGADSDFWVVEMVRREDAGICARRRTYFSCLAKKSRQKKATMLSASLCA